MFICHSVEVTELSTNKQHTLSETYSCDILVWVTCLFVYILLRHAYFGDMLIFYEACFVFIIEML